MFVNSDFSDLLRIFNDNHVTKDLDVWISTDAPNAEAVYKALLEFGAPLKELTVKDFSEDGYFFQMGVPPVRVDVLMGIPGVEFEECWQRRNEVDFDELKVSFISKPDLILAKRASGRPQDMIDADLLTDADE